MMLSGSISASERTIFKSNGLLELFQLRGLTPIKQSIRFLCYFEGLVLPDVMAATSASRLPDLSVPSRATFACTRCAERKVKCDRQRPCSTCVNHKVDCVFQPPRPPQRRRRYGKEHVQLLNDRLKIYESLLREQGIDPGQRYTSPNADPISERSDRRVTTPQHRIPATAPSPTEAGPTGAVNKTQLIHVRGRSMLVEK